MKKCLGVVLFLLLVGSSTMAFAAAPFAGFDDGGDPFADVGGALSQQSVAGIQETAVYSIQLWRDYATNKAKSRSKIQVTVGNWDYLKVGNRLCKNSACTSWYYYSRYNVGTNIWCGWSWTYTPATWRTYGYYYFREGAYTATRTKYLSRYL